jgi:hypothetical protein
VEFVGHRLTVTGMDGRRISRIRVTPLAPVASGAQGAPNAPSPDGVTPEDESTSDT